MTPEERNELVQANLGLATHFAKQFRASRMEFSDIVQEAYRGLIDAADRFDPRRSKFSTYARWHILKTIMEAIHTRNEVVRTPRRAKSVACHALDDSPAAFNLEDDSEQVDEQLDRQADITRVRDGISALPWRHGVVLRLRYGIDTERLTLARAGAILGVTPERVRQIQRAAEEKLRLVLQRCATIRYPGDCPEQQED